MFGATDCEQKRFRSSDAISDLAKDNTAGTPANQEDRCQNPGPPQRRALSCRSSEWNSEQRRHRIRCDVVHQKAVKNIKAPAQPRGKDHRPLVGVHVEESSSRQRKLSVHLVEAMLIWAEL